MRVILFVIVLVIALLVLLLGVSSKKGGIWKTVFALLQIASVSANNRPGSR